MIVDAKPYEYTFDPEKTALLVIDMQRDFCEHGGFGEMLGNDISEVTAIIPQVGKVIDHCRSLGMPVIYTKEGHLPDLADCPASKLRRSKKQGAGIGDMGPMGRIMIQGEPGNDIVPELYPKEEDIVIHKCGKGSFYKTALEDNLQEKGIESLIVTGVTTHVCVQTTIREANVLVKGVEEKMVCPKKRTVFGGNMNEEEIVELAVCGLHMRGFALEHQLTGLGAVYDRTDHTAPVYRMVRTATEPEKPMLVCTQNGTELEVEVWRIALSRIGSFLQMIPAPLGLGKMRLQDGQEVISFVGQAGAEEGLTDISRYGGWRYYVQETQKLS